MTKNNRREFLKKTFLSGLAAAGVTKGLFAGAQASAPHRIKKGDMYYRRLGRTGLQISELCVGGSPLPEKPVLYQAIERGVNYIDTSDSYMNGNSERMVGQVFKDFGRDTVMAGTRFHIRGPWNYESIVKSVEGSLRRLDVDCIDILGVHGVEDPAHVTDERILRAFEDLKKQGKYRFRNLSCHANQIDVVTKALESGLYDMALCGVNVFDIPAEETEVRTYEDYLDACGLRALLSLAKSRDVGIIFIKTLKIGRRRQKLDRFKAGTTSDHQAALKWILSEKNLSAAAIEFMNFQELEEDLAAVHLVEP